MGNNESNECIQGTVRTKKQSAFSQSEQDQDDSQSTKRIQTQAKSNSLEHVDHDDDEQHDSKMKEGTVSNHKSAQSMHGSW